MKLECRGETWRRNNQSAKTMWDELLEQTADCAIRQFILKGDDLLIERKVNLPGGLSNDIQRQLNGDPQLPGRLISACCHRLIILEIRHQSC